MGNIELNRIEIEVLKQLIRLRYGILLIEANNNANYRALCEQINIARQNNQLPTQFQHTSVSEDQLRRLFCGQEERMAFRRYFIQLCYFYACKQLREAYLEAHPIENQLVMFAKVVHEQADLKQSEVSIETSQSQDAELKHNEIKLAELEQQNEVLKNSLKQNLAKIADLEHGSKQNLDKMLDFKQKSLETERERQIAEKRKRFFQKIAFLMTCFLIGLGSYFLRWKERRHAELVWLNAYNMTDSAEAAFLKPRLSFMNDSTSAFRKTVRIWVTTLMEGYKKMDTMKTPLPFITEKGETLIHYTGFSDIKSKKFYDKVNGEYFPEKITWRDSNDDNHQKNQNVMGLVDSVHALFGGFADTIVAKYKEQPDRRSEDFYENLFGVKKTEAHWPLFMFAVFKKDDRALNQSREIIVRYPSYDLTQKLYKHIKYILQGRPWWQDAMNEGRTKAFSWTEIIDNEVVTMGLSRAYSSARFDHRMQQRAFWIDIPLKKQSGAQKRELLHERLFLCVDFTLKVD